MLATKLVERVVVGTALVLGASVLLPIAKTSLTTAARVGGRAVNGAVEGARHALLTAREEVEDIIAEAQFERMKNQIDNDIMH
ncbi:DUF5132 domain-containing protein [Brevibacillus dissolubilis]|uniref:DUF5132 domain-containing protein n=1 Tax=Brevibacillus dissolubilis TaxID=1844116 RepID=UPI001116EC2A|nr:DUF5132 domain-containing protein [Brevibacillus dissolubilis]